MEQQEIILALTESKTGYSVIQSKEQSITLIDFSDIVCEASQPCVKEIEILNNGFKLADGSKTIITKSWRSETTYCKSSSLSGGEIALVQKIIDIKGWN